MLKHTQSLEPKSPDYYKALATTTLNVLDGLIDAVPKDTMDFETFAGNMHPVYCMAANSAYCVVPPLETISSPRRSPWKITAEIPLTEKEASYKDSIMPLLNSLLSEQLAEKIDGLQKAGTRRKWFTKKDDHAPDAAGRWKFSLQFTSEQSPEEIRRLLKKSRAGIVRRLDEMRTLGNMSFAGGLGAPERPSR